MEMMRREFHGSADECGATRYKAAQPPQSGVGVAERRRFVERGRRLEYFTIVWNSLEALAALISGFIAGSVALVGFGLDSLIEVTSGAALLWRLRQDLSPLGREAAERLTLRIVGSCFLILSVYIGYDSLASLVSREAPARSVSGIVIAAVSLIVMPLLSRAKRRVGLGLGSVAMAADARQTDFCTYLSAILLGGLLLNALFGLWWADPAAGLIMVPIIAKEGIAGWRGEACCSNCH
jgi:divalent metal cation (Fe/Co/Zn/Cd) transporter